MKARSAELAEGGAVSGIIVTSEIRLMLHEQMRKHYATWPDKKPPALDGKTAREIVRTAEGREQVALLLAEMKGYYRNLPQDDPLHGFSLQYIADKLELELPKSSWDRVW